MGTLATSGRPRNRGPDQAPAQLGTCGLAGGRGTGPPTSPYATPFSAPCTCPTVAAPRRPSGEGRRVRASVPCGAAASSRYGTTGRPSAGAGACCLRFRPGTEGIGGATSGRRTFSATPAMGVLPSTPSTDGRAPCITRSPKTPRGRVGLPAPSSPAAARRTGSTAATASTTTAAAASPTVGTTAHAAATAPPPVDPVAALATAILAPRAAPATAVLVIHKRYDVRTPP